jgi:FkbM family methyltransferase
MVEVIYSSVGCFTSVREPFIQDAFVQSIFKQVIPAVEARQRYAAFLKDRPFLPLLLGALAADAAADGPVQVVECGVFMGNFSIAAHIQAERAEVAVQISAYEANPALIEPIRANFDMHGVAGEVHGNGIGGAHGVLEFVHSPAGMIGGTVFEVGHKSRDNTDYLTSQCQIIPLREALTNRAAPGLVKIDIEGNEVEAFGSIAGDAHRLNNVFITEYAPYQGERPLGEGSYDDFLLRHFAVFDINNWLWFPYARPLTSAQALAQVMQAHPSRPDNTDLLFIPKAMTGLIAQIQQHSPGAQR